MQVVTRWQGGARRPMRVALSVLPMLGLLFSVGTAQAGKAHEHGAGKLNIVQDGTGKAPELAKEFVCGDDFVLTYGDILVKPETYRHMIERWQAGRFDGVLTVTAAEDVTKGGLFFFDDAQ
ncbi:MAG: hypothetical protein ACK47O_08805, partial [Betaproteobacteria bacterium]